MKKILLADDGHYYKANLHCHTIYSDGHATPLEVKEAYKQHGYSIVAYTDHDIFVCHDELKDENFLPLNGYEVEIHEFDDLGDYQHKTCHLCFIALDKNIRQPVCLHREKYAWGNAKARQNEVAFGDMVNMDRFYSPEWINKMIKMGKDAGFFISYNHPTWSQETYEQYTKYKGYDALELYNGNVLVAGFDCHEAQRYKDILLHGHYPGVTGSDDNHNISGFSGPESDSFVCFTMIHAKELTYEAVSEALKNKDYYASEGPLFKEIWVEDGFLKVRSDKVRSIHFNYGVRRARHANAKEGGYVDFAQAQIHPEDKFIKVTLVDHQGRVADSRAFPVDELMSE